MPLLLHIVQTMQLAQYWRSTALPTHGGKRQYDFVPRRKVKLQVTIQYSPAANAHERLRRALDLILRVAARVGQSPRKSPKMMTPLKMSLGRSRRWNLRN